MSSFSYVMWPHPGVYGIIIRDDTFSSYRIRRVISWNLLNKGLDVERRILTVMWNRCLKGYCEFLEVHRIRDSSVSGYYQGMYICSWALKAERQRIDAFKLWCWRRLLRVSWAARRSNQSILREVNPEYSLEGLMLKFQYFGYLMWRVGSPEETLTLGKIEGKRRGG